MRTLLWDLDPQGAASYCLRVAPQLDVKGKRLLRDREALQAAGIISASEWTASGGVLTINADDLSRHAHDGQVPGSGSLWADRPRSGWREPDRLRLWPGDGLGALDR